MSDYLYRARLSVEIDQDLKDRLTNLVRWGQLRHVVEALIFDLVELLEGLPPHEREIIVATIIAGRIRPKDFIESLSDESRKSS